MSFLTNNGRLISTVQGLLHYEMDLDYNLYALPDYIVKLEKNRVVAAIRKFATGESK